MKIREEYLTKENISGVSILDLVPEERVEFIKHYTEIQFYGQTLHTEAQPESGTLNIDSFLLYELTEFIEEIVGSNKEYVEIFQQVNERLEIAIPVEKFEINPIKAYTPRDWRTEDVFKDPIKINVNAKDGVMKIINALYEEFIENPEVFGVLLKAKKSDNEFYWNPFHPFFMLLPPNMKKELYDLTVEAIVYPTNVVRESDKEYINKIKDITLPVAAKAALSVANKYLNYELLSSVNLVPSNTTREISPKYIRDLYLGFEDDSRGQSAKIYEYVVVPVHMMVRDGIIAPAYAEVIVEDASGGLRGYNASPQISSNISDSHSVCTGSKTSIIKNAYVLSTMNIDSPFVVQSFSQISKVVSSLKSVYKELGITPET